MSRERLTTPLRLGALCAAVLASLASSPEFEPPEPDSCDQGATGSVATLEISGYDEASFVALADDDAIEYTTGGQGVPMIGVRYRLTGADVPGCVSHRIELSTCSPEGDCATGAVFAAENLPLATYADSGGARTTKTLWLLLGGDAPYQREQFALRATVAGVSIERTLWLGERGTIAPTQLLGGLASPTALAVADGFAYWASSAEVGSVARVALDGGEPELLAGSQRRPHALALDAQRVYWSNADDGTIASVPLAGGEVVIHAAEQFSPGAVAVDATHVYWLAGDAERVMRAPKAPDDQPPEVLAEGQRMPSGLAVDAEHVYWASRFDGTVLRLAKAGGEPEVVATGHEGATELLSVDDAVYWANVYDGGLWRFDKADSTVDPVASGYLSPGGLAADATDVYFADPGLGVVVRVSRDGSRETEVARNRTSPRAVAVTASTVYWSEELGGAIFGVPLR